LESVDQKKYILNKYSPKEEKCRTIVHSGTVTKTTLYIVIKYINDENAKLRCRERWGSHHWNHWCTSCEGDFLSLRQFYTHHHCIFQEEASTRLIIS